MNRRDFVHATAAAGIFPWLRHLWSATDMRPFIQPIWYDSDGLIVHRGNDGGDTAQREGWYWLGAWIREHILHLPWNIPRRLSFPQVLGLLEPNKDGVFYRHPKLPPWNNPYSKEFGFSRDQMIPLVAAMGVWNEQAALHRLWNALPQDPVGGAKHTFNGDWIIAFGQKVAHQGDVVGPMIINLFRRAWNENPSSANDGNGPGGELELLANVGVRNAAASRSLDDTGDDLNLIVVLLMAMLRYPTATSQQAVDAYKRRPLSYGSYLGAYRRDYGVDLNVSPTEMASRCDKGITPPIPQPGQTPKAPWVPDASGPLGAVRWYHRPETGGNPELAELYVPIIKHFLE